MVRAADLQAAVKHKRQHSLQPIVGTEAALAIVSHQPDDYYQKLCQYHES